jgi:hypothetical protein
MKQQGTMARRAAMVAVGIGMVTSLGLAGAGAASATGPALHIKSGSPYSIEWGATCEALTFSSSGTFTSDLFGDSGTWSGGKTTLSMNWTAGSDQDAKFTGTFAHKDYTGKLKAADKEKFSAIVAKGASSC